MQNKSRREILGFTVLDTLRSGSNHENPIVDGVIDPAIQYGGEIVLFIMLLQQAVTLNRDRLVHVSATPHDTWQKHQPEMTTAIQGAAEITSRLELLGQQLSNFYERWYNEYYRSHQEMRYSSCATTSTDSDGNTVCHGGFVTETVWEWEEPAILTKYGFNHNTITNWRDYFSRHGQNWRSWQNGLGAAPYRAQSLNDYRLQTTEMDTGALDGWRLGATALGGLSFTLYENVVRYLQSHSDLALQLHTHSLAGIKRRTFLKLGGAALAATAANNVHFATLHNNQQLQAKLENQLASHINQAKQRGQDEQGIQSYQAVFGETPATTVQSINNCLNWEPTLVTERSGQLPEPFRQALSAIFTNMTELRLLLKKWLSYEDASLHSVPPLAAQALNDWRLQLDVQTSENQSNRDTYTDTLGEIATYVATLLGTAIGIEAIVELSHRLLQAANLTSED